jgi:hypothetical protein
MRRQETTGIICYPEIIMEYTLCYRCNQAQAGNDWGDQIQPRELSFSATGLQRAADVMIQRFV